MPKQTKTTPKPIKNGKNVKVSTRLVAGVAAQPL